MSSFGKPIVSSEPDIVLIGGGVMSATLATLLHVLDPSLKIEVYERLGNLAFESSGTLNNAGTGHAALSELNYTPLKADGTVDISKAIQINEEFEISKQLWSFLAQLGMLKNPQEFIHPVPHLSWVHGEANVDFLRKRFSALRDVPLFKDMQFTEDPAVMKEWVPLLMMGRNPGEPMAATRSLSGTDVDYGKLTTLLFQNLVESQAAKAFVSHEVRELKQDRKDNRWNLDIKDLQTGDIKKIRSKFVFIGAGGGSLPLLQKSGIPEAKGYGGFPVGGEFLIYKGAALSEMHLGKIYGQAAVGAPPMSVPHLDTRYVNGEKRLIFGPFAGATTKFLKQGSVFDLIGSLKFNNAKAVLDAGTQNIPLVRYLINQETLSHDDRMEALREFLPDARSNEWESINAGIRVQIIKYAKGGNVLRFGTEVVTAKDGSLAALLGASPGASTSVAAMLEVLQRCFPQQMQSSDWQAKLSMMIPSYGKRLVNNPQLLQSIRDRNAKVLHLETNTCRWLFVK